MDYLVLAWQPTNDGGRTAWRWYWRVECRRDRVLVALIEQPFHESCFETKSEAEAAAQQVIDWMTEPTGRHAAAWGAKA